MSSTNKTANYNLSQFIGQDKPAWLGDYNSDMSKIDAQMKTNETSANAAQGTATAAANGLGDITSLETTNKTNAVSAINEVNTKVGTAQTTANTASGAAASATSAISQLEDYLNLNNINALSWTIEAGSIDSTLTSTTVAQNNTGSLAKLYGVIVYNNPGGMGTVKLISSDTGMRPSSPITFNGCALIRRDTSASNNNMTAVSYTLRTDGKFEIDVPRNGVVTYVNLWACLLFIKNFGDVIINPVD